MACLYFEEESVKEKLLKDNHKKSWFAKKIKLLTKKKKDLNAEHPLTKNE